MRPVIADELCVLFQGDSRLLAEAIPEGYVDAVVCDPPYELGFMGKGWDASGIAYDVNLWRAVYRVLKPGGHLLAFGGTRTYHRMACAIEDAGFEIRDSLHWIYGCLTDDVEVLTPDGWRRGIDVQRGDVVAQWDPASGAVSLAQVAETFRAPWSGDLVRFKNSDTDQALTPNHRVWRRAMLRGDGRRGEWGEYEVAEASTISRRTPTRLPLAGLHEGPGIGGEDYAALLGWVWTEGGFDPAPSTGVRLYQSSVNPDKVAEIDALLDRTGAHRRYSYEREYTYVARGRQTYQAITWFWTGDLAQRVRADLPGKHPTYGLLWRMTLAEKRAFIAAALLGDGSRSANGSWTFEQKDPADRQWFVTLLATVGWRGCDYTRKTRDGGSVSVTQRADTTITPHAMRAAPTERYNGDVWCVRVPTGAFVARRNGKVFITGNSGFPKSLDVSKELDKRAGHWRGRAGAVTIESQPSKGTEYERTPKGEPITAAAAAAAGWGTALKPAHEPVVMARKPLIGTVAANWLAYGTGAINIDACRIGDEERFNPPAANDGTSPASLAPVNVSGYEGQTVTGRWPANVLLSHLDECEVVGQHTEMRPMREPTGRDGLIFGAGLEGSRAVDPVPVTQTQYRCAPGCVVAELDAQSGISRSTKGKPRGAAQPGEGWGMTATGTEHDDVGGASRFFYCAKPGNAERDFGLEHLPRKSRAEATERAEGSAGSNHARAGAGSRTGRANTHPTVKPIALMRYLCRLVTKPGGIILDPFTGSGTTGIAALREGFSFVGVELGGENGEYLPITEGRLRAALAERATTAKES